MNKLQLLDTEWENLKIVKGIKKKSRLSLLFNVALQRKK